MDIYEKHGFREIVAIVEVGLYAIIQVDLMGMLLDNWLSELFHKTGSFELIVFPSILVNIEFCQY